MELTSIYILVFEPKHPTVHNPRRKGTAHSIHTFLRRERPRYQCHQSERSQPRETRDGLLDRRNEVAHDARQRLSGVRMRQIEYERGKGPRRHRGKSGEVCSADTIKALRFLDSGDEVPAGKVQRFKACA